MRNFLISWAFLLSLQYALAFFGSNRILSASKCKSPILLKTDLSSNCERFGDASSKIKYRQIYLHASQNPSASGPLFETATLLSNVQDATELKLVDIKVSPEIASAFNSPGQYVQIKVNDQKPGFYAIASPPDGRDTFTFLIKETDNNKWLTALSIGSNILISYPQGKGFQIEEYFNSYRFDFPTTNLYLLATGSGLAPIASAIESRILGLKETGKNSIAKRTATLYVGARSDASTWKGRKGYIQSALESDSVKVPRNSGALVCGQRGMVEATKDILMTAGVFEGKILLNF